MSRTVTLSQLRTDIGTQADMLVATGGRYTPTTLNRFINQSIQRFRERLSLEGAQHFLVSTTGTLTSGATSPYPFKVIDLSAVTPSIVRTFGVDITLPGGEVRTLSHQPFADRDNFGGPVATAEPIAWMHIQTRSVAILPPPNQSYTYVVWYLPVLADLSQDSDTFDGVAGWEDYVMWDVVCRLIARDTEATAYQIAVGERDRLWTDVLRAATKVSGVGGAVLGRDSLGARSKGRSTRKGLLPAP